MKRYPVGTKVHIYSKGTRLYPGTFEVIKERFQDGNPVLSVPEEAREIIGQDTFSISERFMVIVDE